MEFGRTYFGVKTNLEFKNCLYKCNENDTLKFIRSIPPNINSGFTGTIFKNNLPTLNPFEHRHEYWAQESYTVISHK
jgi:hypothetical protein